MDRGLFYHRMRSNYVEKLTFFTTAANLRMKFQTRDIRYLRCGKCNGQNANRKNGQDKNCVSIKSVSPTFSYNVTSKRMGAFPRGWCFLSPVGKCARQANPIFEMGIVNITIGSCFDKQMSSALTWNKITEIVFVCFLLLLLSAEFCSVKIHELFIIFKMRLENHDAGAWHKKRTNLPDGLRQNFDTWLIDC